MSMADLDIDKEAVEKRGYEDILAHIFNNKDDETGTVYSENELLGEATLLMMAGKRYMAFTSLSPRSVADTLVPGSDTSTTAINTTLFYLSHHPRVFRKLDSELRKCFPRLEDIHPNTAENCQYLRACLDEAMRLCPLAPSNIPRILGEGGIRVMDEELPGRMWVTVPNFTIFRNAEYFDRPHGYIPERWIADESTGCSHEDVKQPQAAFQPFSLGPKHCIARSLVLREMTFALARVFYLFDVEPVENSGWWIGSLTGIDTRNSRLIQEQWDVFTSLGLLKGLTVKLKVKVGVESRF